jgi:hypothetical protein
MGAAESFETYAHLCQTTRRHIPDAILTAVRTHQFQLQSSRNSGSYVLLAVWELIISSPHIQFNFCTKYLR